MGIGFLFGADEKCSKSIMGWSPSDHRGNEYTENHWSLITTFQMPPGQIPEDTTLLLRRPPKIVKFTVIGTDL